MHFILIIFAMQNLFYYILQVHKVCRDTVCEENITLVAFVCYAQNLSIKKYLFYIFTQFTRKS